MISEKNLQALALMRPEPAAPSRSTECASCVGLNASDVAIRVEEPGRDSHWAGDGLLVMHQLSNMYFEDGRATEVWAYDEGGQARRIRTQGNLPEGLYPACPLCLGRHTESETNPNACPKTKKVKTLKCPACPRIIYGSHPVKGGLSQKKLVQIRLDDHIRFFHPATAASLGLSPAA